LRFKGQTILDSTGLSSINFLA